MNVQETNDATYQTAYETAAEAATKKEMARLRAILTHPVAKAVPALAEHYAYVVREEAETAILAMKAAAGWVEEAPVEKEGVQ